MTTNTEEAKVLGGLTAEERALSEQDEPTVMALDETVAEEERSTPAPILTLKPIPNADEIMNQIQQVEENLANQFDDGDITIREYRDWLNQLSTQRDEIRWSKRKVDLAHEMQETAEKVAWQREVEDFMTKGPGSHLKQSHAAMVAFDDIVKKVTADPVNERLSDRAQLNLALKIYKQDMARAGIGSTDEIETARALADMGGARGSADFGSIDMMIAKGDLSGVEHALCRLNKDERDRYGL